MRWHNIRPISKGWLPAIAVAACLTMALAGGASAAPIGSPVIVVNQVTGEVAPAQPLVLRVGIDVFPDEIVKTGANSAARLVFQDKTVLEIGAVSEVRLDRFVYDPDPAKSQVVLSVTSGVVRFATGVLPSTAYVIHTPSATLGVRGTVFTITVNPNGSSCIFGENGTVIVTGQDDKKKVKVKAGETSCVPIGGDPSSPTAGGLPGALQQLVALLSQATTPELFTNPNSSGPPTTSGTVTPTRP